MHVARPEPDLIKISLRLFHNKTRYTRYGYEVPGMILFNTYLYTYSLLRGATFEVLPLSSSSKDAATVGNIFRTPVGE
jgi:hypothetical protein